jgi:hypothetical protein
MSSLRATVLTGLGRDRLAHLHHAPLPVGEHDVGDREPVPDGGLDLLRVHPERAVADEAAHVPVGGGDLGAERLPIPAPSMPNLKVPSTDRGTRASWKKFDHTAVLPPSKTHTCRPADLLRDRGDVGGVHSARGRSASGLSSLARSRARSSPIAPPPRASRLGVRRRPRVAARRGRPQRRPHVGEDRVGERPVRAEHGRVDVDLDGRGSGPPAPSSAPCPTSRSRRAVSRARGWRRPRCGPGRRARRGSSARRVRTAR